MVGRNDPCWCGSGIKWKKCHYPQQGVQLVVDEKLRQRYLHEFDILIKSDEEIEKIRKAGHTAASILDRVCAAAKVGISTLELSNLCDQLHKEAGAVPAALGYGEPPFPYGVCISLNNVICHGIPSEKTILKEGDILNIDIASIVDGFFGDCSRMVVMGKTTPERQRVVDTSYNCLMESIAILKPGVLVSEIGTVIERVAHAAGCSVVYQFVGHGVGIHFHEGPQVPHCRNRVDIPLVPGMTFTIEPMINAGVAQGVVDETDQWTARTADGKPSGQWEHTLLITKEGHEILTPWTRDFFRNSI